MILQPRTARIVTAAILSMTAGFSALAAPAAAPAAAVAPARTVTPRVVPMANTCDLPTEADPGSYWVPPSYNNCQDCEREAAVENSSHILFFYCTYNPQNGKTDLHYDPR